MSAVKAICRAMDRIAPLRLAEKWDNVGLLIESPVVRPNATRVLLTIDLTTAVADEALSTSQNPETCCIVSYHPPLFRPLRALTLANPLQTSLLRCAAAGVSVYCPHTSVDNVAAGVNTWLASAFYDSEAARAKGLSYVGEEFEDGVGGRGRVAQLEQPMSMAEVVKRVKTHLRLEHSEYLNLQVAYAATRSQDAVSSVAICAGSGADLLLGNPADVYLTGEMSHHEVLEAVASGHHVILCGHSNTERGFLPLLAARLGEELKVEAAEAEAAANPVHAAFLRALRVDVSTNDRHPLQIV